MQRFVVLLLIIISLYGYTIADDTVREGQQVTLTDNCYGTVVPETLDKLVEYTRNDNFDMFSTFFKFGYAIFLDKGMTATVLKIQQDKVLIELPNHTRFWVFGHYLKE